VEARRLLEPAVPFETLDRKRGVLEALVNLCFGARWVHRAEDPGEHLVDERAREQSEAFALRGEDLSEWFVR
jgi:hypothetical protein